MPSADERFARAPNVIGRRLDGEDGETLLVRSDGNAASLEQIHTLNATGSWLWDRLDRPRSVRDLCEMVRAEFECEDSLERWVAELLDDLVAEGLVVSDGR